MLPTINVGPAVVQVPGFIILLGLWLGINLAERFAPSHGISAKNLYNVVILSIIAGIIGGRLFYVFRYPEIFLSSPTSLVSLNAGMMDFWGGLMIGCLTGGIYAYRQGLSIWDTLDAITPVLAVISIALALALFASGSFYGITTKLPWGVLLWGATRHPTQMYAALASGTILVLLWPSRDYLRNFQPGVYFLVFTASSIFAVIIIEAFRGDSKLILGGFRQLQVISWFILTLCLLGIGRLSHKDR